MGECGTANYAPLVLADQPVVGPVCQPGEPRFGAAFSEPTEMKKLFPKIRRQMFPKNKVVRAKSYRFR
jgi:hypothetical protein